MPETPYAPDWRTDRFEAVRVERPEEIPAARSEIIDVAVLDMNAGFANVGHDAIVALVRDATLALDEGLTRAGRRVRVVSYAVRDSLMVPDHARARYRLYLGTGGPGHLDPRRNTSDHGAEQILEDPSWEAPLWRLFDAIAADADSSLYAVCHTFGLLCRWSGAAHAELRGPAKGGPMSGVGTNVLTAQAVKHPWFAPLAGDDGTHRAVPVLDSRYYDLIPDPAAAAPGITAIAFESSRASDGPGEALTMLEFARDADGLAPRVFGVNSHPEIGTPERVRELLDRLLANGSLSAELYARRVELLPVLRDDRRDERLAVARRVFGDLMRRKLERLVAA